MIHRRARPAFRCRGGRARERSRALVVRGVMSSDVERCTRRYRDALGRVLAAVTRLDTLAERDGRGAAVVIQRVVRPRSRSHRARPAARSQGSRDAAEPPPGPPRPSEIDRRRALAVLRRWGIT